MDIMTVTLWLNAVKSTTEVHGHDDCDTVASRRQIDHWVRIDEHEQATKT